MQPPQVPEETSFLSPVPRERHGESTTPSRRSDAQRPSRIIKLPPVAPERKQSPDRKPIPYKKQVPDKKPQPGRSDCKTQLKLVDKDVTTGRSYIKALDKRFRILKRNLERALNECQGRRLEEASFKQQLPEAEPVDELQSSELQVIEIQGSELAVRPPEPAVYEIEESNWGSVLDSIQGILPTIVQASSAARDYSNPELQPACSFRYYNRGQRYGRRYGSYDSDFDSYNDYYRRHGVYGRRHYSNRRRYGYSDAYDDPVYDRYYDDYYGDSDLDYEYRRPHYGRKRGYDSYYGRRRYGRSRDRWLSSNKMGKERNNRFKGRPRFRVKRHKYDEYEDDFSDDFESASDEDYSKSSGFDSFSDRSYSGQSESMSRSDESRARSRNHSDRHQRRGRDAYDRRQEADHYEGRENRRKEDRHREGKKGCSDCHKRKYHNVSYRRLYNYPRSRCHYGSRGRYRGYYSDESSLDSDMDYGLRSNYGRSRYRRHGRRGLYGRGRQYGRYGGGRYRSRRSARNRRRRYDRYCGSDSDYDSDTDNSSSDGRHRRDRSGRRYGGKRYYLPRYYVSTKCRPECQPKAIEQLQPEKKADQSSKSPGNAPLTKIEAITC